MRLSLPLCTRQN